LTHKKTREKTPPNQRSEDEAKNEVATKATRIKGPEEPYKPYPWRENAGQQAQPKKHRRQKKSKMCVDALGAGGVIERKKKAGKFNGPRAKGDR